MSQAVHNYTCFNFSLELARWEAVGPIQNLLPYPYPLENASFPRSNQTSSLQLEKWNKERSRSLIENKHSLF